MRTTPEKHTKSKRRETLGNAYQNKTSEELGTRRCMKKETPKGRIKEPDEMLNKTKTLTTTARLKKAKEKGLK